jgi:hypothetical protein
MTSPDSTKQQKAKEGLGEVVIRAIIIATFVAISAPLFAQSIGSTEIYSSPADVPIVLIAIGLGVGISFIKTLISMNRS